jgi:hypothetical protein
MIVTIRCLRAFHSALVADLERKHKFAYERVGWVFAKNTLASPGVTLLHPVEYVPVKDDDYVQNENVGACFNAATIRAALQRSRSTGWTCLQTHLHDHLGHTSFSRIDIKTIDDLAPSFRAMAPDAPHGGLVLSRDSATARLWLPGARVATTPRIVLVGFPMLFAEAKP